MLNQTDLIPVDAPDWRVPKSAPSALQPGSSTMVQNVVNKSVTAKSSTLAHATSDTYPEFPPGKWQKCGDPPPVVQHSQCVPVAAVFNGGDTRGLRASSKSDVLSGREDSTRCYIPDVAP